MNKPFDEFWKSARNRMTALGAVPLSAGEDAERNSCGHEQAQADAHLEPVQTGRATAGIDQAPTEAERAVDKHWPKYFAEWAKLQQAANLIAAKESK